MKERLLSAFRNWNPDAEMSVKMKFVKKGTDTPLTGDQYIVRLYDREIFQDDEYLGHSQLNDKGEATIHFSPTDIKNYHLGFSCFRKSAREHLLDQDSPQRACRIGDLTGVIMFGQSCLSRGKTKGERSFNRVRGNPLR